MGVKIGGGIERVNGKELRYEEFVERYLSKNQPVVLAGLMGDWRACSDWVSPDGRPNLPFFSTHFGLSKVQVADCNTREFTDQKRVEMSVKEFIDHWLLLGADKDPDDGSRQDSICSQNSQLYLKDWHFVKEYSEYVAYRTPIFFRDDWLNLYLDHYPMHENPTSDQDRSDLCCSDYRFVYMGAKGTWTPLHADVFRSYSWSANVCGQKQWLFLSPNQSHLIYDRNMKYSVYSIFEEVSESKFHGFNKAIWLECIQEANEIIFVPSGWYHQVHNMEDTVSINHNWFNAYNLCWVWDLLSKDYDEAKGYIEDIRDICDDFESLCQRNLAANTGMNFHDFFNFLARFSFATLVCLSHLFDNENTSCKSFNQSLTLNLVSIREMAKKMKSVECLAHNQNVIFDFRENFTTPKFIQLCDSLSRTYGMIHKQQRTNISLKNIWWDTVGKLGSCDCSYMVCTPEDLIRIIDHAVSKLGINSYEMNGMSDNGST
uniref:JmjC domain-containing protein n=1 Tax=Kalanchoe fedtschenkoi TaxID=63787 RepID=A0A7N0ZYL9_KALFE